MFFSFEGIDGSGKSTQARLLADTLRNAGHEIVEVREPGGTRLGERVRSLLLDPDSEIADRAELLLFSAARAQLVADVIRPALSKGAHIIADRFFDSSTAYQGAGRALSDLEWMESLHHFATNGMNPDRTYFIDTPLDIAASRRDGRDADRMERANHVFYERVRDGYRSVASSSPGRVLTLDGTQPVDRLKALIEDDARSLLAAM